MPANPKFSKQVSALAVIVLDRRSRQWLRENDPMAFRQAVEALSEVEGFEFPEDFDHPKPFPAVPA